LATIRVRDAANIAVATHHVEVIAGKFGSAEESVAFLKATLAGLFAQIESSPFVLGAPTERVVRESFRPPSPIFLFHFFRHHGDELIRAIQAVLGRPHQRLDAEPELVRPHEVRHIDRESIVRMLQAGHSSPVPIGSRGGLTALQQLRPERVWQHIPVETYDTPENRFVLAVCRRMLAALHGMTRAPWYARDVTEPTQAAIKETGASLAMLTMDDRFAPLGPMVVTPAQSRVLQRRDGYRELAVLWQRFQRAREPIFTQLESAIDLRSVDQLYELWVLFELIAQLREITGETPVVTPVVDQFGSPRGGYRGTFAGHGTLVYNENQTAYSTIRLRPDYLWQPVSGAWVALDAKFRLKRPAAFLGEVPDDPDKGLVAQPAWAKDDDLTKMHAYRDALPQVRAAVVLYPGTETVFRDVDRVKRELSLGDLLRGDWHGVGAIAMQPHGATVSDQVG
jgi:predicted component of viral defense system (DUF524 family)